MLIGFRLGTTNPFLAYITTASHTLYLSSFELIHQKIAWRHSWINGQLNDLSLKVVWRPKLFNYLLNVYAIIQGSNYQCYWSLLFFSNFNAYFNRNGFSLSKNKICVLMAMLSIFTHLKHSIERFFYSILSYFVAVVCT